MNIIPPNDIYTLTHWRFDDGGGDGVNLYYPSVQPFIFRTTYPMSGHRALEVYKYISLSLGTQCKRQETSLDGVKTNNRVLVYTFILQTS